VTAAGTGEAVVTARIGALRAEVPVTVVAPGLGNAVPYPGPCLAEGYSGPDMSSRWTERWTYDDRRREVLIEHVEGGRVTVRTTSTWDDADHRVAEETHGDDNGPVDVVETWTWDGDRLVRSTKQEGPYLPVVTEYHYDETGRLADEVTTGDGFEVRRIHVYDAGGREASAEETETRGGRLEVDLLHEYTYDARGRRMESLDTTHAWPDAGDPGYEVIDVHGVDFGYDDADRLIAEDHFRRDDFFGDILESRVLYLRDLGGNVVYWQNQLDFDSPAPEIEIHYTYDCWR
jgi:hypothetical protein